MSKYTTEVRFICETLSGLDKSKGYVAIEEIISKARTKIFDFDYPIFDENYKEILETKILKHYYTREIGEETLGLWKLRLNAKLNEIMVYYNKLYKSELLEFNPLYTKNIERKGNTSNKDNNNVNTNNETWNLYNDTPQGGLSNVQNMEYLTSATRDSNNGNVTSNGVSTSDYLESIVGYDGVNPSKMVKDYRSTFLNIDMQIIRELDVLFMQLW